MVEPPFLRGVVAGKDAPSFPRSNSPRNASPLREHRKLISFFVKFPLQATVWQRQEDPVKALRFAAMNALNHPTRAKIARAGPRLGEAIAGSLP